MVRVAPVVVPNGFATLYQDQVVALAGVFSKLLALALLTVVEPTVSDVQPELGKYGVPKEILKEPPLDAHQ